MDKTGSPRSKQESTFLTVSSYKTFYYSFNSMCESVWGTFLQGKFIPFYHERLHLMVLKSREMEKFIQNSEKVLIPKFRIYLFSQPLTFQ